MSVTVETQVNQIVPDNNVSNYIPMSMGLAKGDILVYRGEGDLVRLEAGEDGQVLTVDSTSELGVKWATLT